MRVGRQPDVALTREQLQRDRPEPREQRRMPHPQHTGHVPQYNITNDGYEGHVAVYLVAVEGVAAEEGEGHVGADADEREQCRGEGEARSEEVRVVVVVEQAVALREEVRQRENYTVCHRVPETKRVF